MQHHHQPGRILVIDMYASNHPAHMRALGFEREKTGRRRGKWSRRFPGGEIARAIALEYKFKLADAGILSHIEYEGKPYAECGMYCLSARYPHHTEECVRARRKSVPFSKRKR